MVSDTFLYHAIYSLKAHRQRLYKKTLACSHLNGQSVVPLIGVYSTPSAHDLRWSAHQRLDASCWKYHEVWNACINWILSTGTLISCSSNPTHRSPSRSFRRTSWLTLVDTSVLQTRGSPSSTRRIKGRRWKAHSWHSSGTGQFSALTNTGATMASDVYAFGMLIYEVSGGRYFFRIYSQAIRG